MTFVDQANTSSLFIDTNDLLVVLVYEDNSHRNERAPLRLGAYQICRVPHGVQWGGPQNNRLHKNLTLAPQHGARGQRIDRDKHDLLALALRLDRRLSQAARHPAAPWSSLRLPQLWAAYHARQAGVLRGEGPEFELACHQQCRAENALFRESSRQIAGLTAYPLDWVSGQLEFAAAIFAEVTPGMRRQTSRVGNLPDGLIGFQGASEFDFYSSRFRNWACGHRPSRRANHTRTENLQNESRKTRRMRSEVCVA